MMAEDSWLEVNLREQLRPVSAPAGLWSKIQAPGAGRRAESDPTRLLWPAIALLMLLASADLLWEFSKARGGLRQIAQPDAAELAALAASPEACELNSNDPVHIRQWIKSHSGIELELPAHSPSARVTGARIANIRGTLVASVRYEAGDNSERGGTMLVWKSGKPFTGRHEATRAGSEMVSWSQGENIFAAVPAEGSSAREACLLCHSEGSHWL